MGLTAAIEIAALDATAQADLVRKGEVTAVELVDWAIQRIEALDPQLKAVVTRTFEQARIAAAAGRAGPFAGVPTLCKDLALEQPGVRFTEGSRFLRDNTSTFESELAARYRRSGLVSLGPTHLSSAWRPPASPSCSAPRATPGTPPVRPAAPVAAPQLQPPPAWCPSRTGTTWVARCATRHLRAGCSRLSQRGPATPSRPATATS
jgi:amidase